MSLQCVLGCSPLGSQLDEHIRSGQIDIKQVLKLSVVRHMSQQAKFYLLEICNHRYQWSTKRPMFNLDV